MIIIIIQKNIDTGATKSSKLFLVDLASLKKVGKTNSSRQALEEAKKVNKSLSTLHMVINSLTDGKVCTVKQKTISYLLTSIVHYSQIMFLTAIQS
jgi:hypothetical protein